MQYLDRMKIDTISLQKEASIDAATEAAALAAMGGAASGFVRSDALRFLSGRNESGRLAAFDFLQYHFLPAERTFVTTQSDSGVKIDGMWFFLLGGKDQALPDGPLAEAERCIIKARRLLQTALGAEGKVDHLLVIGLASQTACFNKRIAAAMKDTCAQIHFLLRGADGSGRGPRRHVWRWARVFMM